MISLKKNVLRHILHAERIQKLKVTFRVSAHPVITSYSIHYTMLYDNNYTIELLDTFFAPLAAENPRTEQINHTLTYIHKNLSDPGLSLGDISKANYMSVPYLCMYFKEQRNNFV